MPVVRKVEASEAEGWIKDTPVNKGARKAAQAEYDQIFKDLAVGEGAEITLDGEKKLTVKHRVSAAAKRAKVAVQFLRSKDTVKFRVDALPASE